jgi:hypothetical protein
MPQVLSCLLGDWDKAPSIYLSNILVEDWRKEFHLLHAHSVIVNLHLCIPRSLQNTKFLQTLKDTIGLFGTFVKWSSVDAY